MGSTLVDPGSTLGPPSQAIYHVLPFPLVGVIHEPPIYSVWECHLCDTMREAAPPLPVYMAMRTMLA